MPDCARVDVVVLGGGPAGAAAARLLAHWGHSVLLLDKAARPSSGLAESLPPSTRKLLAQIGVLDAVERAGFLRATGNTFWWGFGGRRVEPFEREPGYQVHRPAFDRMLLDCARDAGAAVRTDARVRDVRFPDDGSAIVEYDAGGRRRSAACRFVLDCTGRAGVIGRRFRQPEPGYRTCALVGVWDAPGGWDLPDDTHTIVETYDEGWMWSVPTSSTTRHAGAMVDRASPTAAGGRALEHAYRVEIAKAANLSRVIEGATLQCVWACDASLYSSTRYAGPQFLLIGDAGSFIDPLSSFGVKKALASAWLGAIAVHTCLTHPDRQEVALEFFTQWEQEVYAKHLGRSRQFACEAQARHPHAFWASRAADAPRRAEALRHTSVLRHTTSPSADAGVRDADVLAAFERLRQAPSMHLTLADDVRFERRPVIRDREIVLEDAFAGPESRFLNHVDLVQLAGIACRHTAVPDVFEDYCRTCAPVPLRNVVSGLSLLVAKGILHERA